MLLSKIYNYINTFYALDFTLNGQGRISPDLEVYSDHSLYLDIDLKIIMLHAPYFSNVNKFSKMMYLYYCV